MPLIIGIVPIVALAAIIFGGGTLSFYFCLDEEEQEALNELAFELFEKTVQELNKSQSKLLKRKFFR